MIYCFAQSLCSSGVLIILTVSVVLCFWKQTYKISHIKKLPH